MRSLTATQLAQRGLHSMRNAAGEDGECKDDDEPRLDLSAGGSASTRDDWRGEVASVGTAGASISCALTSATTGDSIWKCAVDVGSACGSAAAATCGEACASASRARLASSLPAGVSNSQRSNRSVSTLPGPALWVSEARGGGLRGRLERRGDGVDGGE